MKAQKILLLIIIINLSSNPSLFSAAAAAGKAATAGAGGTVTYKAPDNTPCGFLSQVSQIPKMSVGQLLQMFIGPLYSLLADIKPVKKWLNNAYLKDVNMGQQTVQACNTAGYFMQQPMGGRAQGFAGFQVGRLVSVFSGIATIDGEEVEIKMRMDGTTLEQNAFGMGASNMSCLIGLPKIDKQIKMSRISPIFKALDDLEILEAAICICGQEYYDEEWQVTFNQGVNFVAKFDTAGKLGHLVKKTGYTGTTITLQGLITSDLVGSYFSVEIQKKLHLGKLGSTEGNLTLAIYFEQLVPGAPIPSVAIGLRGGFTVHVPRTSQPVLFEGELRINIITTELTLSLWMEGMLRFDKVRELRSIAIGNVVIAIGINPEAAAESAGLLTFTEIFLGGTIEIGNKQLCVYGGIDIAPDEPDYMLDVELTGGLTMRDLVTWGCDGINEAGKITKSGLHIDVKKVVEVTPELGFKTLKGYLCTRTESYAGRTYQEGAEIDVELDIFKKTLGLDVFFQIEQGQFRGYAWMSKFELGPIYVTGRGPDMIWNTADDGPVFRLEVDVTKPPFLSFFASGLLDVRIEKLEALRAELEVFFAPIGFACEFDCKIFDIFEAYVLVNLMFVPVHEIRPVGELAGKGAQMVSEKISPTLAAQTKAAVARDTANYLNKKLKEGLYVEAGGMFGGMPLPTGKMFEKLPGPLKKLAGIGRIARAVEEKVNIANEAYEKLLKKYASKEGIAVEKMSAEQLNNLKNKYPDLAAADEKLSQQLGEANKLRAQIEQAETIAKAAEDKAKAAKEKSRADASAGKQKLTTHIKETASPKGQIARYATDIGKQQRAIDEWAKLAKEYAKKGKTKDLDEVNEKIKQAESLIKKYNDSIEKLGGKRVSAIASAA